MNRDVFETTATDLEQIAEQVETDHSDLNIHAGPAVQLREVAQNLRCIDHFDSSTQNGMQLISEIGRACGQLTAISRTLGSSHLESRLRQSILDLLNGTPQIMKTIIPDLPANLYLTCQPMPNQNT